MTWLTQVRTTHEHTVKKIGGSGNGCNFEGGHCESVAQSIDNKSSITVGGIIINGNWKG